jgi:hypothetical protein
MRSFYRVARVIRRRLAGIRQRTKSFQVVSRCSDSTDPAARAVCGVEVTTGDTNQSKSIGPGTDSLAFAGRKAWSVNFDGIQTLVDKCVQLGLPEVMGWMGQCGNAAGLLDQNDCLAAIKPMFVHAGRTSIPQITCEDVACTGHLMRPRQVVRQMAPTQACAWEDTPHCAQIDQEPERSQSRDHRLDPLASTRAKLCHCLQELLVIVSDKMPQNMKLTTVLFARKLDPRDEFNAPPQSLESGHRQGRHGVVIGDRQRRQADPGRGDNDFTRRANPVGMRCVDVQISGTLTTGPT